MFKYKKTIFIYIILFQLNNMNGSGFIFDSNVTLKDIHCNGGANFLKLLETNTLQISESTHINTGTFGKTNDYITTFCSPNIFIYGLELTSPGKYFLVLDSNYTLGVIEKDEVITQAEPTPYTTVYTKNIISQKGKPLLIGNTSTNNITLGSSTGGDILLKSNIFDLKNNISISSNNSIIPIDSKYSTTNDIEISNCDFGSNLSGENISFDGGLNFSIPFSIGNIVVDGNTNITVPGNGTISIIPSNNTLTLNNQNNFFYGIPEASSSSFNSYTLIVLSSNNELSQGTIKNHSSINAISSNLLISSNDTITLGQANKNINFVGSSFTLYETKIQAPDGFSLESQKPIKIISNGPGNQYYLNFLDGLTITCPLINNIFSATSSSSLTYLNNEVDTNTITLQGKNIFFLDFSSLATGSGNILVADNNYYIKSCSECLELKKRNQELFSSQEIFFMETLLKIEKINSLLKKAFQSYNTCNKKINRHNKKKEGSQKIYKVISTLLKRI